MRSRRRGLAGARRPGRAGTLLALLALAFIAVSPYFCRLYMPQAYAAVAAEARPGDGSASGASSGGGVSVAELEAVFGSGLAFCGSGFLPASDGQGDETKPPPELFCLACQLAKAGAPLLPQLPELPKAQPAPAARVFPFAEQEVASDLWSLRVGLTRAPPTRL
ncbi:hypothetical protein [Tistlia consotensis]|uniref:hypothetical protein n=1 Tax=Tistlia consotensis TaxID=1321365 RepID=UPI000B778A29|nr:hypothetical protein [Tistlia consotensis]